MDDVICLREYAHGDFVYQCILTKPIERRRNIDGCEEVDFFCDYIILQGDVVFDRFRSYGIDSMQALLCSINLCARQMSELDKQFAGAFSAEWGEDLGFGGVGSALARTGL